MATQTATDHRRKTLDVEEIQTACRKQLEQASGSFYSTVSEHRANLDKQFHGRPYGDEVEDRSQVVSTDIADTIAWIIPALIKIFAGSEQAVRFEPQNADDEEAALQETDVCSYVFYRQNDGFHVLYEAFHDALIKKNCVIKTWWEEREETRIEEYAGLEYEELIKLLVDLGSDEERLIETLSRVTDDGSAVIKVPVDSERSDVVSVEFLEYELSEEEREVEGQDPTTGAMVVIEEIVDLFSVKLRIKEKIGKAKVTTLAPENFLLTPRWDSIFLDECPFTAHREVMPRSRLIEMGYDREQVESLSTGDEFEFTEERMDRHDPEEADALGSIADRERGQELVLVAECYIRIDQDGDGVAELLKVTTGGPLGEVLRWQDGGEPDIEEVARNPFQSGTPLLVPHKFYGQSIAEIVQDIQRIKTVLQRQMLDNIYLTNNMRPEIAERGVGQYTIKDLLNWKPGAPIRVKEAGNLAFHHPPAMWQNTMPTIEYMDSVRENRTGITRYSQGLDSDSLNQTATGIMQIMDASRDKIELIARSFGEFLVRPVFREIRELMREHATKPMTMRLRGEWQDIDTRRWRNREDMSVSVGLGTGNRDIQIGHLTNLLGLQQQIGQFNPAMVRPINTYNALAKMIQAMGMKQPEEFFNRPDPEEEWPDPNDGAAQAEQAKMQIEQGKLDLEAQKVQVDMSRAEFEAWAKSKELEIKHDSVASAALLQQAKLEADTGMDDQKIVDNVLRYEQINLERDKMEKQAQQSEMHEAMQDLHFQEQQAAAAEQARLQAQQKPTTNGGATP